MKYALSNDARARSVAKDLVKLAKDFNVKLPLTSAQKATAGLFGYTDWNDLMSEIGGGVGPEDHELTAADLDARRTLQRGVLLGMGFDAPQAERIISLLRPTGRTEASIKAFPKVWPIQTNSDHHPSRFRIVLDRFRQDEYYGWDGVYDSLGDIVAGWASMRPLVPMDLEACTTAYVLENLAEVVDSLSRQTGHVVEVSALVSTVPGSEDLTEGWDVMPRDPAGLTFYYFHFGNHRFPSPFKGVGVDGCYVNVVEGESDLPDSVDFTFTTSPEFERDVDLMLDNSPFIEMRGLLRNVDVSFSPGEGETIGDALKNYNGSEYSEEYVAAWRPYLQVSIEAVWRSLKLYRGRSIPSNDALFVDSHQAHFAKLERSTSEINTIAKLKEISEEGEDFPVRFLGRVPPDSTVCHEEMWSSPYPRGDSGPSKFTHEHVESKLADFDEVSRPWSIYYCGKAALEMCDDLSDDIEVARYRLVANANIMNGAHFLGAADAVESAKAVLSSGLPEAIGSLHGAVIVFLQANEFELSKEAVALMEKIAPDIPMSKAARLLVAARLGTSHEVERMASEFTASFPDVVRRLLARDQEPWGWFRDQYEDDADMNDHVACVFRAPFKRAGLIEKLKSRFAS